jgi:hypothetical protein
MNKLIINLIDESVYADSFTESIMRAAGTIPGELRTPKKIQYVKNKTNWDGITLFTDKVFFMSKNINSKYKVAIVIEPRDLLPYIYEEIQKYEDNFDLILTHDEELLNRNKNKYVFMNPDSAGLGDDDCKINKKSKLVSMVYSEKTWLFGHRLRHIIADSLLPKISYDKIELFGKGCNKPIKLKAEGTVDFMFQIAIENAKRKNYFADKILDCFACGTVPIYWGCNNIGDFFDERGIIKFNSPNDLAHILKEEISEKKYKSMLEYIKNNHEIFMDNYLNYDDIICNKIVNFLGIKQ